MTDHETRIAELVDREMYDNEAMYHAQVSTVRRWLKMTEQAMADEGVASDVGQRVLNRLVYGVPDAADSYLRRDRARQMLLGNYTVAEQPKAKVPVKKAIPSANPGVW